LLEEMRILIVAGIPVGVLVAGVGSRLAMLLLRVTSPDSVLGVTSDDGFTIGRFTAEGSYNLLMLGALIGIIGAGVYQMVAPWLLGPNWFRLLTTGLASAAVVGSMLVHSDGIDFRILKPTWLAIGLFVALPGVFGILIGPAVDAIRKPNSWTVQGRRRWLLPVIALVCFPFIVPFLIVPLALVAIWAAIPLTRPQRRASFSLGVRSIWLLIAVAGLLALLNDIRSLT
jgi:hypothetical protein